MKPFVCLTTALLLLASGANAEDCMAMLNPQQKCLGSDFFKGKWSYYLDKGDPCFPYSGGHWCFYRDGGIAPCDITEPACSGKEIGPTPAPLAAPEPFVGPVQDPPAVCETATSPCTAPADNKYCANSFDRIVYNQDGTQETFKHTMCDWCGVANKCGTVCNRGFITDDEKKLIVSRHNVLRRKVAMGETSQEKASDMYELVWDEELARIAQLWADQCPEYHDKARGTDDFSYVGQNMADKWTSNIEGLQGRTAVLLGFVDAWFNEIDDFPVRNPPIYTNAGATGVIGHYTQVAWGKTTKIGCGYMAYKDSNKPNIPYRQTLVCNYGTGGNYSGQKLYSVGEAGTKCPKGARGGLCRQDE